MEVRIDNLSVYLGGRRVVSNASLRVGEGELILITGPSGSGKTTLLRALLGVIPNLIRGRVEGNISPSRKDLSMMSFYVPQEPWYSIITPFVWSEICSFTGSDMELVRDVLARWGMRGFEFRTTYTLSAGELQRLSLIIASLLNKKVLILDEPASHLDPLNAEKVVRTVKSLKELGVSAIVVDHNVNLWDGIADQVYSLVNGCLREGVAECYSLAESLIKGLHKPKSFDEAVLKFSLSSYRPPGSRRVLLRDVELSLRRGEILLVKGPSGVGKSTLLRLIASSVKQPVRGVKASVKGRLLYIPDNPLLYFTWPTPAKEVGREGLQYLKEFSLNQVVNTPLASLSTGERRRVAIASALSRGAAVALLDEPTVGLDPLSKFRVLKAIASAAERGMAFIIASHDPTLELIANEVVSLG